MHATEAYVNGAGVKDRAESHKHEDLGMMKTLLAGATTDSGKSSPDEQKAREEKRKPSATSPGGFKNDPDDASNPNEVRERHLRTVKDTNRVKGGTV